MRRGIEASPQCLMDRLLRYLLGIYSSTARSLDRQPARFTCGDGSASLFRRGSYRRHRSQNPPDPEPYPSAKLIWTARSSPRTAIADVLAILMGQARNAALGHASRVAAPSDLVMPAVSMSVPVAEYRQAHHYDLDGRLYLFLDADTI